MNTSVYVIQINNYTELFSKMSVEDVNNLVLTKSTKSTESIKLTKYKLSNGHETLLDNQMLIQNGDIIVIRPDNQFVGAMQQYEDFKTPNKDTKTNRIYDKLIALDIPYYVRIKGDGACFYYSFVYGLFMTALLKGIDPSEYLKKLEEGMNTFVANNEKYLKDHEYTTEHTSLMQKKLQEFRELVLKIHNNQDISSTIKRLMLDSIFNSFPNVMESLRFAVKCVWLNHYFNNINSINKSPHYFNTYEEEIDTILPKYEYASNAIIEVLPSLFDNVNAPIVVYERVLINDSIEHINQYYDGFQSNGKFAFMAYTGGHYDVALKANFQYEDNALIKKYIIDKANQPANQPVNDTGFTQAEMDEQTKAYKQFEDERNKIIDEAISDNIWNEDQLKVLATEPGIKRIFANNNNFTDKVKERLSQLRDFIVNKGSLTLLDLLHVHTKDFNPLSKPDDNASRDVLLTYLYAVNPKLYNENKGNTIDEIKGIVKNLSLPSTTNPTTNPNTTPTTNPTTNPSTKTYYSAWVKILDNGTVTDVVFDKPAPAATITTLANKSGDTYVEVQFTLSDTGFASELQFPKVVSTNPNTVSKALDEIYNNKSI